MYQLQQKQGITAAVALLACCCVLAFVPRQGRAQATASPVTIGGVQLWLTRPDATQVMHLGPAC